MGATPQNNYSQPYLSPDFQVGMLSAKLVRLFCVYLFVYSFIVVVVVVSIAEIRLTKSLKQSLRSVQLLGLNEQSEQNEL